MTLEVGTILVYEPKWGHRRLIKIDRVTAKRAYSGTNEFKREQPDITYIKPIGLDAWDTSRCYLAIEEDIRAIALETEHRKAASAVEKVAFKSLTIDQLTRILAIVGERKESRA